MVRTKEELGQGKAHFPGLTERVREERKMRAKSFLLRSIEYFRLVFVRLRTKVHRIDKGYEWVPRKKYFSEDPGKEFREIEVFGFRKLPTLVSTLQDAKDSSYLGLHSIFGPGKEGFSFKGLFGKEKLGFRVLSMFLRLGDYYPNSVVSYS